MTGLDLLRGLVMVIMALDHVRDYVAPGTPLPEDMPGVEPALFFTRWITHFCAPVFVFLAGTGAFLYGRRRNRRDLAMFLLTRGLWLIVLELTVVFMGWWFAPPLFFGVVLQVIWAIGVSMIVLAGLIWMPRWALLAFGLAMIAGHNLLDGLAIETAVREAQPQPGEVPPASLLAWSLLHADSFFFVNRWMLAVIYPIVPWVGVMGVGYVFGQVMTLPPERRRRWCLGLGLAATALFIALRATHGYGDSREWATNGGVTPAVIGFLNCEKYPPSLHFLLMTLGPSLMFLAIADSLRGWWADALVVFGRVPLFFYIVHVPLVNLLGAVYFQVGFGSSRWIAGLMQPLPDEYELRLLPAYVAWALCIAMMYPMCRWFAGVKATHRSWWIRYL